MTLYTKQLGKHAVAMLAGLAMIQAVPVIAQSIPAEYNYEPIRYKGFKIVPALTLGTTYSTNIFATSDNEESDYIYNVKPALSIEKQYGASQFILNGSVNYEKYQKFSDENRMNYNGGIDYSYDFNSRWSAGFGAEYSHIARNRQDPTGLAASATPLYVDTLKTQIEIERRFNRLSLTLLGSYKDVNNENGVSRLDPSQPILYSIADRSEYGGEAVFRYDLVPGGDIGSTPEKALYLRTGVTRIGYNDKDNFSLNRDHNKISALFGFIGKFVGLNLTTDIGAGYIGQQFEDNNVKPTHDFNLYADIQYNPSQKHTLTFGAKRDVTQDNAFINGIVETNFTLGSQYELQHNLFLNTDLGYELNEYDNSRKDTDYIGSIGLNYLINRKLTSSVVFGHTVRDSNMSGQEFDRSTLMLRLTGRL